MLPPSPSSQPLKEVAETVRGKLMFVLLDIEQEQSARVLEFFGVSDHKKGVKLVGFELETSKKYQFKDEITTAALKTWVDAVCGKYGGV